MENMNVHSFLTSDIFEGVHSVFWASQVTQWLKKNLSANAGDTGDEDLIPGPGRSPGGEM